MARAISIICFLAFVGFLTACPTSSGVSRNNNIYKADGETQAQIFKNAPGLVENKYNEFLVFAANVVGVSKKFIDDTFPADCRGENDDYLKKLFAHSLRFFQDKAKTSEKVYLSYTDPKKIKQVTAKASEIDACYENSRNLVGVSKNEVVINFCSYNMPKALECANEIFKDSTDSPLAALEAYTNYFVKDFDCEHGPKDKVYLDFYDGVVEKHEVTGRQTFFHGYQRVALDFTKFT